MIWFSAFVVTGSVLLIGSFIETNGINMGTFVLIIIGFFYLQGITSHLKELQGKED